MLGLPLHPFPPYTFTFLLARHNYYFILLAGKGFYFITLILQ
jgi:hypothetical protein